MRVLFVLGGPGAGKGTQCTRLAQRYGFVHLSAGDLLRAERASGSANGEMIDRTIREGQIVPVQVTLELIRKAMVQSGKDLFLIDGFPRNEDNLQGWEEHMNEAKDTTVEGVLFFDCPEDEMEKRLIERGKTSGRSDDNLESIRKRFRTYIDSTMPIIKYYEEQGKTFRVNAVGTPDEVFERAAKLIEPLVKKNEVEKSA